MGRPRDADVAESARTRGLVVRRGRVSGWIASAYAGHGDESDSCVVEGPHLEAIGDAALPFGFGTAS